MEATEAIPQSVPYLRVPYTDVSEYKGDDDERRSAEKLKRSFERLRRAAVKTLEALPPPARLTAPISAERQCIRSLLLKGVDALDDVHRIVCRCITS